MSRRAPLSGLAVLASVLLIVACGGSTPAPDVSGTTITEFLGALAASVSAPAGPPAEAFDPLAPPTDSAESDWADVIGHYTWADNSASVEMVVHERDGRPWLQVGTVFFAGTWRGDDNLVIHGELPVDVAVVVRDGAGTAVAIDLDGARFERGAVGPAAGTTFRIEPLRPVEELREEALRATPPLQAADLRAPELVELTTLEPGLQLDIRYATTNNFMGAVFYREPRAFMQRPAAESLVRVHRRLADLGYGLRVFDAYRPWYVTRMFWDATPEHQRDFVADPANGSRHNRGCAVDLTLYELSTGEPVVMTGGYDEFTERSYADYAGGTSRQRWNRELLRWAMEAEGFAVYEFEWWHFDFEDWEQYPILDLTFDRVETR